MTNRLAGLASWPRIGLEDAWPSGWRTPFPAAAGIAGGEELFGGWWTSKVAVAGAEMGTDLPLNDACRMSKSAIP